MTEQKLERIEQSFQAISNAAAIADITVNTIAADVSAAIPPIHDVAQDLKQDQRDKWASAQIGRAHV